MIECGKAYHIKDEYFDEVSDDTLMQNKDDKYRPNVFVFADEKNPDIYWAVPISSKVDKYRIWLARRESKHGACKNIIIGKFAGRDAAYLIQNMFPITEKYVDHEHTIRQNSVHIDKKTKDLLVKYARDCLELYRKGNHNIIYSDIYNDYQIMLSALKKK